MCAERDAPSTSIRLVLFSDLNGLFALIFLFYQFKALVYLSIGASIAVFDSIQFIWLCAGPVGERFKIQGQKKRHSLVVCANKPDVNSVNWFVVH